jgi:hypothetical protein
MMKNPLPAMQSFIFGPGTDAPTYQSLKKRREIADLLRLQASQTPKNVGEGIGAIGKALLSRYTEKELAPQEDAERSRLADLLGGFGGPTGAVGGAPGGFTGQGYSGNPATLSASNMPPAGSDAVVQALVSRGMPEHIAEGFALNFQDESGMNPGINEASPIVPGSRGGFGLAQWTGPRRDALEGYATNSGRPDRRAGDDRARVEEG